MSAARVRYARIAVGACLILLASTLRPSQGAALDDTRPERVSVSVSSGLPWEGRLLHAVKLRLSAMLRPVADYVRGGNFYGTAELVSLLERTARSVATRWPGSVLSVGELSAPRGGQIAGHHSHRSGRDVDVAFFMHDDEGDSARFWRFVKFGGEGRARNASHPLYFDDARNWALVSAMLRDPEARVQYMFVAKPLRTRLLKEGRRRGESDAFLRAAAAVLVQPRAGHKHDNHFHVRIYCAKDDRPACRDSAPYWPWYDGAPPDGSYAELPLIRWRAPRLASPTRKEPAQRGATSSI